MPTEKDAAKVQVLQAPTSQWQALKVQYVPPEIKQRAIYWCGALPSVEPIDVPVNTTVPEKPEIHHLTTAQLWNPSNEEMPRRWIGKCRYFQNLSVTGMEFVAYSEKIDYSEGHRNVTYKPGTLAHLDEDQVGSILANSVRKVVREVNDVDDERRYIMRGILLNCDQQGYAFDARRDNPIARFVYMVRLPSEHDWPSMEEFFRNPPKSLMGE